MNRILIILLLIIVIAPMAFAHGDEDHAQTQTTGKVSSGTRKAARTISANGRQFQFLLTQSPADPRTGEELQFEIRIDEIVDDGTANKQLPLEDASVIGKLKMIAGGAVSGALATHKEGQAGLYGIHYKFTDAGDYKLLLDITDKDGKAMSVDFPVAIVATPVRYTPYLLDLILLIAAIALVGFRYRALANFDRKTAFWRTLPYGIAACALFSFSAIAIHYVIPATEPRVAAAPVTSPSPEITLGANTIQMSKESQILFNVRTVAAEKQQIVSGVTVTGVVKVQSQFKADVVPPVSGRTRAHGNFTVGSYVKQGQTLAVIEQILSASEAAGLEATRTDLRAKTAELQAQATQALTKLNAAQVELTRAKRLYDAGAAPLKRVQEAEVQVEYAEQELKAANQRAEITQVGEKRVDPVRTFSLTAPISGVIASLSFTPGEQVEAGKPLFTIINLDRVWIEAAVFEKDLAAITSSKRATFKVAAYPDAIYQIGADSTNRLLTVGASVDPEKHTVPVVYEVANPNGKLRDGMTAEITLDTTGDHEVISVPKAAVLDEQGQKIVFVYNGGEQFTKRKVTVGSEGQTSIEILTGLEAGERVVVEGISQLRAIAPAGK